MEWMVSEGWHVSLNILASCYKLDPNGWFAAVTNDTNELIGKSSGLLTSHFNCIVQHLVSGAIPFSWLCRSMYTITATSMTHYVITPSAGSITGCRLDDDTAFGGFFIVRPDWRKRGVGKALWDVRMTYLGQRNFGIDAVEARVKYDSENGFKHVSFAIAAYLGPLDGAKLSTVASLDGGLVLRKLANAPGEVDKLLAYDTKMHVVPRRACMQQWITPATTTTYMVNNSSNDDVMGYGCIQPMEGGHYHVGPVFADTPAIGEHLLGKLFECVPPGKKVGFDIPVANNTARKLAAEHGLVEELKLYRMYTHRVPQFEMEKVFAFTTMGIALV